MMENKSLHVTCI